MLHLLQSLSKWIAIISLAVLLITLFSKDDLPSPAGYDLDRLTDPKQEKTFRSPFSVEAGGQSYKIDPEFAYQLEGVVVSYHDADAFSDIWHHDKWKDFLNVRDLCVIWGANIDSGVYQDMSFKNDSWTCWAYWPDAETGSRFKGEQLSNNHLLTDDMELKRLLMSAETGDHIRLEGLLARYENPSNGFHRGTSTVRTDSGNGACETIYLERFEIVQKANNRIRSLYHAAKWILIISLCLFTLLFFITPVKKPRL
ncbi:MAG: hypothetical protein KZQ85_17920 [Candidatus Thiodiazotropha sp. (ex Myrtea sp. 'scaly one' KF741663)]|nr:hypothetical protein [Candidatus Thiodiazotropha sp. (ex Myrtea sp. 'scaly one' KF741663)]